MLVFWGSSVFSGIFCASVGLIFIGFLYWNELFRYGMIWLTLLLGLLTHVSPTYFVRLHLTGLFFLVLEPRYNGSEQRISHSPVDSLSLEIVLYWIV